MTCLIGGTLALLVLLCVSSGVFPLYKTRLPGASRFTNQLWNATDAPPGRSLHGATLFSTHSQNHLFASFPTDQGHWETLVFKVLMYPNHYSYWGSYLDLARMESFHLLCASEKFLLGLDQENRMRLRVQHSLDERGKNLALRLWRQASQQPHSTLLVHPHDEFRTVWSYTQEEIPFNPSSSIFAHDDDALLLASHNNSIYICYLSSVLEGFHTQLSRGDVPMHSVEFPGEGVRSLALRRHIASEEPHTTHEAFVLTDSSRLYYLNWNASAPPQPRLQHLDQTLNISPQHFSSIHMNHNRDCVDNESLYVQDPFRCSCNESLSRRFLLLGEKAVYHIQYTVLTENDDNVSMTLLQTIPLPLHCVGEHVLLSRSKDDLLLVLACSNKVHLYLSDGEQYHWMENDHVYPHGISADLLSTDDALSPKISSISIHNFASYYLTISFQDAHWSQYRVPGDLVRKCDPRSRITSFFLPPAPMFPDEMHRSVQSLSFESLSQTWNPYLAGLNLDQYNLEIYGLLAARPVTLFCVICFFLLVSLNYGLIFKMEKKLYSLSLCKWLIEFFSSDSVFYLSCGAMFAFSIFEVINETDFINDWPAHIHHVRRFWAGELDYGNFMHHHGPCTYAGGFLWLYSLFEMVARSNLQIYQFMWALLEVVHWNILRSIIRLTGLPPILSLFAVFSNRLHLYNVRVVINDFPSLVLMHFVIWLLLKKRWLAGSLVYSFVVSTKLNFVFYSPAILFILLHFTGFSRTVVYCMIMGVLQALVGLPFMLKNVKAYIGIAYDVKRTLLWEKTKNMKFLGRLLYHDSRMSLFFLLSTISCIVIVCGLVYYVHGMQVGSLKRPKNQEGSALFLLLACNLIFIVFARGFYTPFLCWYLYSLPMVLYLAEVPYTVIGVVFGVHEGLMRNWGDMESEMWVSVVLFLCNLSVLKDILVACVPQSKRVHSEQKKNL